MRDDRKKVEIERPLTLHVVEVVGDVPNMDHLETVQIRNVDLELTKDDAIKLRDYLTRRIREHHAGTIRARCKARLEV